MMASGISCQFGEHEHPAAWLITNLVSGATFSACDDDAPPALIMIMAGLLGADAEALYKAIEREIGRQVKADAKAAAAAGAAGEDNAGNHIPGYGPDTCPTCSRKAGVPTAPCPDCRDYLGAEV